MIKVTEPQSLEMLDEVLERIDRGYYEEALTGLYTGLLDLKQGVEPDRWRSIADAAVRHPLADRIHRDPMTRRSFSKPRGYAGDAVLLDYIYGLKTPDTEDAIACAVYEYAAKRPAAKAVRYRRESIARTLDETAERAGRPIRVLSIAAGHLREMDLCTAYENEWIEEFVALDSDAESCAQLASTFPGMEIRNDSFVSLFRERELRAHFDVVYSAGLFDYLDERLATRLTRQMFELTRPGGTVLLTNFLPTTLDAGYMETFMGWELIYRTLADLDGLTSTIPTEFVSAAKTWADPYQTVGYLQVTRSA